MHLKFHNHSVGIQRIILEVQQSEKCDDIEFVTTTSE